MIVGRVPYLNGFEKEDDPVAVDYLELLKKAHAAFYAGTLYIRFNDGDRKGSIAKVIPDPAFGDRQNKIPAIRWNRSFHNKSDYRFENNTFYGVATWDDRRNKVKVSFPDWYQTVEILLDYDGPTIWQKFDAGAAKEEVLKNPDQRDINDDVLEIGDRVLYINLRYGSGAILDRGNIKEFKVVANSKTTTITTIIESNDGELSELSYPGKMVWKVPLNVS